MAEEQRENCLKAIKTFVEARRVDYVLCSRYNEFKALETRLDVPGEVVIQALKPAQINSYLKGKDFAALRTVMKDTKAVRDFAEVPFMLNTMAVVTRDQSETSLRLDIEKHINDDELRDYFLENYLDRRLREETHPRYPNVQQTRERLAWLASQLVQHQETDFYIENLQPDWMDSKVQIRHYRWATSLVYGLVSIFLGWIVFGLLAERLYHELENLLQVKVTNGFISVSPALWILGGLCFGVIAGQIPKIQLIDRLVWSFSSSDMMKGFRPILLALGLVIGLIFALLGELIVGLSFALIGSGLLLGIDVLMTGIQSLTVVKKPIYPNEGIKRSFFHFLYIDLVLFFGSAVLMVVVTMLIHIRYERGFALGFAFIGAICFTLAFVPITAMVYGGLAVLQHVILRLFLARAGHIPWWRYDRFLDYAADRVILRKVGGGYRFVHDYLRQYLARERRRL